MPLFVLDERLLGSRFAAPNRVAFMREALADLYQGLRRAGGRLFIRSRRPGRGRRSRWPASAEPTEPHVSADWSAYAKAREERLARRLRLNSGSSSGPTLERPSSMPGAVTPAGGDHFKVFTPDDRAWSACSRDRRSTAPRAG